MKRVESWLKDSEEDVTVADSYLEKKREKKRDRGSNVDLRNDKKGLGTLHEDKPMDTKTIVANTDVISAKEVIEGASSLKDTPRKKTPPQDERKKALIRSLGRSPSEEKVSLYVRKSSKEGGQATADKQEEVVKRRDKKAETMDETQEDSKKKQFLQDMARRSVEVP